jgi:prepilin-type N-terminal cleavage/methylation domain-containing protein|tara:strand:+ start:1547 stop:2131 length:585 start_codon:yes stop_codon:yes gene_type:complete
VNNLNSSRGITLIELLVVIGILGIFSGIGFVSFNSIDSGSNLRSNKEIVKSYLEQIRSKAFSDGKHYKVTMENSGNDVNLKLYEPDFSNTKWRDLNLNRRCACYSGIGNADTSCNQSFSNVSISSLTSIQNFDKKVKNLEIKNCNNLSCAIETPAPVEFCFLYDGTSPQDKFFKIGNSNLDLILKVNKTGYVEY